MTYFKFPFVLPFSVCYAIPGRVVSVEGKTVTVDYFGELRKAYTLDCFVRPGGYVYAQGGIIVGQISKAEALPILAALLCQQRTELQCFKKFTITLTE